MGWDLPFESIVGRLTFLGKIRLRASTTVPLLLVGLIFGLTSFAYFSWSNAGIYLVSGDEPHYLVIAKSLVERGTLEVSETYRDEMVWKRLYLPGMTEHDRDGHVVRALNGMFSAHNIGLPLLLAIPFGIAGVVGVKFFMIFLGALATALIWRISGQVTDDLFKRISSTLLLCLSPLILAGATQIYPDILSGIICAYVLQSFYGSPVKMSANTRIGAAVLVFLLPWLQIKLILPMGILLVGNLILHRGEYGSAKRRYFIIGGGVASLLALAYYNEYAFGRFTGPYSAGALEVSWTSLMVLAGLLLDQNQGFLFQNPVHFIGVIYLFAFIRKDPQFGILWGLVWLSLLVPNGLHTTWYGGGCLSGRFEWASTIVFAYPTAFGLSKIRSRVIAVLLAAHVLFQGWQFHRYVNHLTDLFNRGPETWSDTYSIFFPGLSQVLPMLYNRQWAYDWNPNYLWSYTFLILLFSGMMMVLVGRYRSLILWIGLAGFAYIVEILPHSRREQMLHFDLTSLPSQTGRALNGIRVAEVGDNQPGYLIFGPYLPLAPGQYVLELSYKSPAQQPTATLEIFNSTQQKIERKSAIQPSLRGTTRVNFEVTSPFWSRDQYEFRVLWGGYGRFELETLCLLRSP